MERMRSVGTMGLGSAEFSGYDSAERVKRLQAFCAHPDGAPTPNAVDGILIIGGVDSYHAEIAQAVIKYLLIGSSGQELLGKQVISQEHDRLEEVVLLITRQRISIFYSSESDAAVKVLPMISQWRNVSEYTIHDTMEPDEQEKRKIEAFKCMVSGLKRIGIPYGIDASTGRDLQDVMIPEKYPLVQSFGLEDGANGKGFFTMNHTVVNVSTLLRQEMAKLDDFSAKRIVQEVEPLLTHHYNQFLMKLDQVETPQVRDAKSEVEMAEDLLSFYDFGTTQYEARGITSSLHRGSRVLFGKRTSVLATKSSSSAMLSNSGCAAQQPATHMVVQTEDPFTGVRFSRTYFLSTGKIAKRIIDEDALVHPSQNELLDKAAHDKSDNESRVDTTVFIELYVLLLRGLHTAIKTLVKYHCDHESDSLTKCIEAVKAQTTTVMKDYSSAFSHVLQDYKLPTNLLDEHFVVNIECLDACARDTAFPAPKWNLVFISLELKHIPSQLHSTESLGSVIVGDTILFKTGTSGLANVTSTFPYFRSWIQSGSEFSSAQALLAALQSEFMLQSPSLQLGRPLMPLDASVDESGTGMDISNTATTIAPGNGTGSSSASLELSRAMLLLECEEFPILHGSMQLFSGGFCFKTPHVNPMLLSFAKHVSCCRILSTPYEELVLLQLELKQDAETRQTAVAEVLPFSHQSRCIAFPLLAGTRFQVEIVHALATWKTVIERLEIPFYRPHDRSSFDGMTPRDGGSSSAATLAPVIAKTCETMVTRKSNSAASSHNNAMDQCFTRWFIPKDSNPNTTLPKPKADRTKLTVPITITMGLPGSDTVTIAKHICDISSAAYDWMELIVDCRDETSTNMERYVYNQVQTRVGASLKRVVSGSSSGAALPPRVMLSVIGYVDPVTVAAAIKNSSTSWPLATKISSVIGCVSALNVYVPDSIGAQNPLPKLFDQLSAGFTTHIVLTQSSEVSTSALGRVRYHMDQVNPFADIHVLTSDVFAGPITSLLTVDRFESGYYKTYRDVHFPAWDTKENWEEYVAELAPEISAETVRFEIAPGMEKSRFLQKVGKGLTPVAAFSQSMMDKVHPVDVDANKGIRLAQSIAAEKVRQSQSMTDSQSTSIQTPYDECWCVEARLTFAGDAGTVYDYVSTGSFARLKVISTTNDSVKADNLELKVTGRRLDASKLNELVLSCYATLDGVVQPLRNKVTMSLEEKREIQKKHELDPLPAEFFFDGTSYVDTFGRRYEFHPNIKQFVEEHVALMNEEAMQNNAKVEENRKSQQAFVKQIV